MHPFLGFELGAWRSFWALAAAALGTFVSHPGPVAAQTDVEEFGRRFGATPPPGFYAMLRARPNAFQFSPDNGWIRRGRAVASRRNTARSQAITGALLAPGAFDNGVLQGDLNIPVFLILYSNTDSASLVAFAPRATIESRLYGTAAAPPYSVHTYYREVSNDSLRVNGTVFEWTRVPSPDTLYEGGAGCNGLGSCGEVPRLVSDIVQLLDDNVDFREFDNDGPDGVPNSLDDDGVVDGVVLVHPEVDGFCKAVNSAAVDNIWAHMGTVNVTTDDVGFSGKQIRVRDYIIQGGQGGDAGCTSDQPVAFGIVAHETGHLFGLPDLYDTGNSTAGIGRWGIMGSGNQQTYDRPAHMSAWSRAELGWVTEVLISQDTLLDISPIETADTAYVIPIAQSDEYFLLGNRQRIGSDSMLIEPGLLIWHVDSVLISQRTLPFNTVNAFLPHGLALEQADGLNGLSSPANRGDPGDPWPGSLGKTEFSFNTTPSTERNDGTKTFITVDQIQQLTPFGAVRAGIAFGKPSLIAASDTLAKFRLDGVSYGQFEDLLEPGTLYTLDMDAVQVVNNGRNRYTWVSWSNGQPRTHDFTASATGDTIIATVAAEFLVQVTTVGTGGSVSSTPTLDLVAGEFLAENATVSLVATVTTPGHVFDGWSGDAVAAGDTLDLTMTRSFLVTATFSPPLAITSTTVPDAVMGALYQQTLVAAGGTGTYTWRQVGGTLPGGVALAASGVVVGTPTDTGTFSFDAQVLSGSQRANQSFQLVVSAPALVTATVVEHLIGTTAPLSASDINYLDLIGNQNGRFDVGDFLAWVQSSAATPSPAELSRVLGLASDAAVWRAEPDGPGRRAR